MRLLADECISGKVVRRLLDDGHDVLWATGSDAGGADDELLTRSVAEGRILISEDRDFGDLVFRLGRAAIGVVLVSLDDRATAGEVAEHVGRQLTRLGETVLRGRFTVLQPNRTRQRDLPPVVAGR